MNAGSQVKTSILNFCFGFANLAISLRALRENKKTDIDEL
jgi:hypothetical protein